MEDKNISINDLKEIILSLHTELKSDISRLEDKFTNKFTSIETRFGDFEARFTNIETRFNGVESQLERLENASFTPSEKKDVLAMVHQYNNRLEDEVLGKQDITLTRPEYDATATATGFPNRFEQQENIIVD